MSRATGQRTVRLVGVPMDLGAGRRGVDMGPSAIRIAGVSQGLRQLGFAVEDDGDVGVPAPETRDPGQPNARYLEPIYHVCNRLRLRVRRSLDQGEIPVVLGGWLFKRIGMRKKQAPADAVSAPVAPVAEAKPQETAQTVMDLNKPDDADIR